MTGAAAGRGRSTGFHGREPEVRALDAGWRAIPGDDRAPVIVVHGEPGIGKTRTVSEFARSVRARGGEVLSGAAYEGRSVRPYGVWREALSGFLTRLGAGALQDVLGAEARWLAPLAPEGISAGPTPAGVPAGVARVRLAELLTQMLETLPIRPVVVLDDMQWADSTSLDLLDHVTRLATSVLVVVIFRGAGLELGHPLAQVLARVQRHRSCEYLPLDSLSRDDGGHLLEQAAGSSLDPQMVDALYRRSGGNPFFLGELGRYLLSHGDTTLSMDDRAVPESIRAAVGLRVTSLSAEAQRMLRLASVFTGNFDFVELAVMTDLAEGRLLDCVEEALAEELLQPLDAERYTFAHALVRQTLYEQMSSSRRARLHRRLAEALERLYDSDPSPVAGELVRQYHASATLAGAERGATHALSAGRAARAAYAPADAILTLSRGLELAGTEDHDTRGRLLNELALAQADCGQFSEARATLEAAVALLERQTDGTEAIAELVWAAGPGFWVAAAGSGVVDPMIDRALFALGDEHTLAWARLKLLEQLIAPETFGPLGVLGWNAPDPEAVQIVREVGTEADYAYTLNGSSPRFGDELEELVTRVDGWQDPIARLHALVNVVGYLTLVEPGRMPAVTDRLCGELELLADDLGLLPQRAAARTCRAMQLANQGELIAAAVEIQAARRLLSGQSADGWIHALVVMVGELTAQHTRPDWPHVADVMWGLATSPEHFPGWITLGGAGFAAYAYVLADDVARAREILDHVLPAITRDRPLDSTYVNAIDLAGVAIWELRDADLAERLLPNARVVADHDPRGFFMTSSELTVARLSAVTGRIDQALDYFERARVVLEGRRQPVLRAIVDHDEAVTRLEHHRPNASRLLDAARTQFVNLGMSEWSRRLSALEVPVPGLPDGLTPREAEILRLVGAQRTNKAIAAELVLSVHTVERHVQNAYRKIGANRRIEAVAYVLRVDL
jgi:DNA-binding CsgD family transcriptional regulator/tetratricopeptide (TPR) repeat protein